MFSISFLLALCCFFCSGLLCFSPLHAQSNEVDVTKQAETIMPKVQFLGVRGNPELSKLIESDLKNCGWFELSSTGAHYTVSGTALSSGVQLQVQGNANFNIDQGNIGNARETAHHAVDKILNKIFGIKGICSYKIAFSYEIKPGVKEICIADFDGSNIQQITRNNSRSVEVCWGPKNRSVLYTLYGVSGVYVGETDLTTKKSRRLAQHRGLNSAPALSPTNTIFALTMSKDNIVELYAQTYGGKGLRRLTQGRGVEASPVFSPNGVDICYVSDERNGPGRPRLWKISVNGGQAQLIPTFGSDPTSPDWSLDNLIIYAAKSRQGSSLFVTDLTGKKRLEGQPIVSGGWENASWAPDNRHIIAQQVIRNKSSLWIIDTWTGTKKMFIREKGSLPCWQKY